VADHDERDDYADNLPPSQSPALRDIVLHVVLGLLFVAMLLLARSRYW